MYSLLLEINPLAEVWGISPSSVFGVLAALLLIGNIVQWRHARAIENSSAAAEDKREKKEDQRTNNYVGLLRENLHTLSGLEDTIKQLANSAAEVRKQGAAGTGELRSHIHDSRDRIIEQIGHIKERMP